MLRQYYDHMVEITAQDYEKNDDDQFIKLVYSYMEDIIIPIRSMSLSQEWAVLKV